MPEPLDIELRKDAELPASEVVVAAERPIVPLIALAMFIVLAGGAAYLVFVKRPAPPAPVSARATTAPPSATRALGGEALPIDIPPLDASDPVVRTLIGGLSANPTIASWLTTNGLIRQFVVAIANVTDGATPAARLKVIAPKAAFQITERDGNIYVDPRSYDRYRPLADAAASIDAAGAARLYATLKPRFNDAFQELGLRGGSFDATFRQAIVTLGQTPIVTEPILLRPKGIGYRYADDRLEQLTPAQKQLLRMGPDNLRRVKEKMREVASALGVQ